LAEALLQNSTLKELNLEGKKNLLVRPFAFCLAYEKFSHATTEI
jgi:hypothetical protein